MEAIPDAHFAKEIIRMKQYRSAGRDEAYRIEYAKEVRSIYKPNQSGAQITRCVNALI